MVGRRAHLKDLTNLSNLQMENKRKQSAKKRNPVTTSQVRQMIKASRDAVAEKKSYDVFALTQPSSTLGNVWNLTQGIVAGDTFQDRDGRQIYAKDLQLHMRALTGATSGTIRFILFQDRMANGVVPTVSDVLSTVQWLSEYNQILVVQEQRFKILHDVILDVSIAGQTVKSAKFGTSKLLHNINYLLDTDVVGANGRNALYLIVIGSNATCIYDWSYQLRFIDQ